MSHELIPYAEVHDREERGSIGITAITRLKHADLWAAAKKFEHGRGKIKEGQYGGQAAMARKLKIPNYALGKWINLQGCPPKEPTGKWTAERLLRLETILLKLTGKSLDELFPDELRANIAFLRSPKQFERTAQIETRALARYAIATRDRMLESQNLEFDRPTEEDLQDSIQKALEKLSTYERRVLELRFGLNGHEPHTLEQCAPIIGVLRERIRQIESRALRRIDCRLLQKFVEECN
jgi:hypothetical protein